MVRPPKKVSHMHSNRDPRLHEFFKVFIPHHSTHRLLIPSAFQKHLQGFVPRKCTILNPAGQTWSVNLEKEGNNLFLKDGWQKFVKHHSLEIGNFLVFRYGGSSTFSVQLFGKNGCAKTSSVAGNCCGTPLHQQRQEELEVLGDKRKAAGDMNVAVDRVKAVKGGERKEDGRSCEVTEHRRREAVQMEKNTYGRKPGRPPAFHGNSAALDMASKYISEFPSFRIFMTRACFRRRTIHIPRQFARTHIKGGSRSVYLQVSERSWLVKLSVHQNYCLLTTGWAAFARENNLQKGDVAS
ncbi:hypothetical protein Ancab_026050 [Ancistrocladus abbreviatus]